VTYLEAEIAHRELYAKWQREGGPRPPTKREFIRANVRRREEPAPAQAIDEHLNVKRSGDGVPNSVQAPADPLERDARSRRERQLREEHSQLVDMLREERERNTFLRAVASDRSTPKIVRSERTSGLREMTAVAVGSDWHVEEEIPAVKAGYRNEYNLDIAADSIERFFRAQINLVRHHRASRAIVIRDMVCAFIGDLMTGHIHEELVETASMAPMQTALWLKPRIIGGLKSLLDELDLRTLTVPWCYGNHGRSTPKSRIATGAEHSYEYLLGRIIQDEFEGDERVRFAIDPAQNQYVQAYEFTLGFHHGDSVGYAGGVGGIGIPLLKALAGWDSVRHAHLWHVGHFHQFRDYGRVMVNGSMIGYGPYSQWIRAPFEEPKQIFYLLDSQRAKVHVTPLWMRPDAAEAA
jgi:hypothetical protein